MENTTKSKTLNKDGTPRAGWGTKFRSTKPRKTKAGLGAKFPKKVSSLPITEAQESYLIRRANLEDKTIQDIVRFLVDQAILQSPLN